MKELAQINIGEQFKLNGKGISQTEAFQSLGNFISAILPNIYILAGLIMLFLLIGGGLMFIVGAGQESPERAGQGKKAITAALAGFLVIFVSYWIIQIIEIVAGIKIFEPGF